MQCLCDCIAKPKKKELFLALWLFYVVLCDWHCTSIAHIIYPSLTQSCDFCRPLPPLPKLEVSDVVVEKAADRALVWINKVLAVGHDIAIKRDRSVFIKVILILWVVSYIGMLFNFLTLIYIGEYY
jgi:hypothetical protein